MAFTPDILFAIYVNKTKLIKGEFECMSTQNVNFKSIDDILGEGDQRFFSAGFKKVLHQVGTINVDINENGQGYVTAKANVFYPSSWSKKTEDTDLKPHLSTIDALVLAVQMNEVYLNHMYGLDENQRKKMWLRRFVMKAGSTPQEDLTDFTIETRHLETKNVIGSLYGYISIFESKVGTIKVRCEIEHEMGERQTEGAFFSNIEEILGTSVSRYFGTGYKLRKQIIEDVVIDNKTQRAEALITIEQSEDEELVNEGLEAYYRSSLSAIDCMTSVAQLGQALLYTLDNIHRSKSNTLWMRQVIIERKNPNESCTPFIASTQVAQSKLLKIKGNIWRTSELTGTFKDFDLRYYVAHELPVNEWGNYEDFESCERNGEKDKSRLQLQK